MPFPRVVIQAYIEMKQSIGKNSFMPFLSVSIYNSFCLCTYTPRKGKNLIFPERTRIGSQFWNLLLLIDINGCNSFILLIQPESNYDRVAA